MADFPNVPIAPGVPPLNRQPGVVLTLPPLLTSDALGLGLGIGQPAWGIFLGGAPVIVPDSIRDFGFRAESAICDYPLERGAFESYNKVDIPYDARVVMNFSQGPAARGAALAEIDALSRTLLLYDVATPEKVYTSCNIIHYDYRRQAMRGAHLLAIEVWLREVRVTAREGFTPTQQADGAATQSGGTPQTQAPTPEQAHAASGTTPPPEGH